MRSFARLACFVSVLVSGCLLGTADNARAIDLEEASAVPTHTESERLVYDMATEEVTASGDVVVDREDFQFSADTIRLNRTTNIAVAEGNARATIYKMAIEELTAGGDTVVDLEDLQLSADTMQVNLSTNTAVAEGNAQAISGGSSFSGDRLELDLEKKTGTFSGGTLFLEQNNYHIQAGKIEKVGPDSYRAEDAIVTTCDGESPAWEVEGKKLDITIEGYGTVNHALFRVKKVPVFYVPYLIFPVKLERQSGLLAPDLGISDKKGFRITQPYFWAISDSMDATVYADYMSRRGVKTGIEYRYFLSADDKGVAMFDFLDDRKVDDGSGTSSQDWGYDDDRYLRPNSDRYWLRMKHDQVFGRSALMLDLDVVSDQDYLYDFKNGYSGYIDSRELFEGVFSRSLDDYNEPVRKNRLGLRTQWPGYSLSAEALWWDDVIARRLEDTDDTVQSLPAVYFERYKQPLFGTKLYAGFETRSAYFYREDGSRGGRIDLYPRLYLPYRFGRVLSVEPSLGGRETLWQVDRFGDDAQDTERTRHRELYDFRLDLSSEIYNVFRPNWGEINALKHATKFQVEYDYTPTLNQETYPYFDGLDRIDGENIITYSIVNTFTTRRGEGGSYKYGQAVRFEVSQSYDIGRERAGDPEPFSPIEGDLQLDLGNWCRILGDAAWSPYDNKFISRNIAYRFSDERGDSLVLQHRYADSLRETLRGAVTLKFSDHFWIFSEYERNLKDDLEIGKSLEAVYRAQCWSLEARYEEEDDDRSIGFVVTFYGLGDMGDESRHSEGLPSWARDGL